MRSSMGFFCLLLVAGSVPLSPCLARAGSVHAFNSGMNCNGVWRLPDTGQTGSYTATAGEDHDYQPAAVQPRYTVMNPVGISSVTVDNVTGLTWVTNPGTDAGIGGTYEWNNATAIQVCENLNYAGYTDWRLPNIRELLSIVDYGAASAPRINTAAFPGTASGHYWSSTTSQEASNYEWYVDFSSGKNDIAWSLNPKYIRCVRGGQ